LSSFVNTGDKIAHIETTIILNKIFYRIHLSQVKVFSEQLARNKSAKMFDGSLETGQEMAPNSVRLYRKIN